MDTPSTSYSVMLSFEKVQLPPFSDILVLGRKSPVGMAGISKSIEYLVPNNFDLVPLPDHDVVEAMIINRVITKRIPLEKVIDLVLRHVAPQMLDTEMIRVDLAVRVTYQGILVE